MTRLIIVRHGESEANRDEIFAGFLDVDLQPRGVEQAKRTAQYIADNYKLDCAYASDLKRAFRTGKYIADLQGIDIIPDEGLREINGGEWEGLPFRELGIRYPEDYRRWRQDIGKSYCTGGETVVQMGERVMATLTRIAEENKGKTVLVATHATPIRVVQCLVQDGNLENMQHIPWVSNASVSVVTYEQGVWQRVRIGEDAHLSDLRTELPTCI